MRYVKGDQSWGSAKENFWGTMEEAEAFVAKLVSDQSLKWRVDDHLRYISAIISENPLTSVSITLSDPLGPELWVSTNRHTSPSFRIARAALAEDLTDHLLQRHREVLRERESDVRATLKEYMES